MAGINSAPTMALNAVLHCHAEASEKDRHRSVVLRHRPPFVVQDRDTVILHLVNHHVVSGLFQHRRHFIGGGAQCAADNFYGDGIDRHVYLDEIAWDRATTGDCPDKSDSSIW